MPHLMAYVQSVCGTHGHVNSYDAIIFISHHAPKHNEKNFFFYCISFDQSMRVPCVCYFARGMPVKLSRPTPC